MKIKKLSAVALVAAVSLAPFAVQAAYPDHPIKIIVPYTAGGPADILARYFAQFNTIGQSVTIEYKPGAGLAVGAAYVAASKPDGYTLLVNAGSMYINSVPSRTPEQNLKEFAPISEISQFPIVVVVNNDLPIHNIPDLVAYAKAHAISFGSSGIGSETQLAGELLNQMAGIKIQHVPYRGIAEALTDVMAGRMQVSFPGAPVALPLAKNGQVRALAVTSSKRAAIAPDLPTVAESGNLPGYDVAPWYGILAPAGTPREVIDKWHADIVRLMQTDELKKRWLTIGADAIYSKTPEDFGEMMKEETDRWAKLVKDANLKLQ
jgi:tripartite-type tricarboxylate transporter receptor subunit TctC